jgi:hypothetical protein
MASSAPPPRSSCRPSSSAEPARYNARPALPPLALKKSDFHYELPEALIAQAPLAERSASRLLLVPPGDAALVRPGRARPAIAAAARRPAGVQRHPRHPGAIVRHQGDRRPGRVPDRAPAARQRGARAAGFQQAAEARQPHRPGRRRRGRSARARGQLLAPALPCRRVAGTAGCSTPVDCRCRPTSSASRARTMPSATRPCSPARSARSPRPPPACISTMRCWTPCANAACSSATSPCMSVPARSSRCGSKTSASTACTASG